jgi:hypothetical protein
VRPFLVALGYLLGGFASFQHLGNFNRLHLACLVFGDGAVGGVNPPGRWDSRPVGLPEPDAHQAPAARHLQQALLINRSSRWRM